MTDEGGVGANRISEKNLLHVIYSFIGLPHCTFHVYNNHVTIQLTLARHQVCI